MACKSLDKTRSFLEDIGRPLGQEPPAILINLPDPPSNQSPKDAIAR
jgi:hypothetical protein